MVMQLIKAWNHIINNMKASSILWNIANVWFEGPNIELDWWTREWVVAFVPIPTYEMLANSKILQGKRIYDIMGIASEAFVSDMPTNANS